MGMLLWCLRADARLWIIHGDARAGRLLSRVGALQLCDVELLHLHHRFADALGFRAVRVLKQLAEHGRDDLPRHAVFVLQPSALHLLSAGGKLLPQLVDLLLGLAIDDERYRFVELELRSAVEREELLPVELEGDGHHGSRRTGCPLRITGNAGDLRVLEDGGVELRCLLGLAVEPQERGDLLHLGYSSCAFTRFAVDWLHYWAIACRARVWIASRSTSVLRLARPASKSSPTMRSPLITMQNI